MRKILVLLLLLLVSCQPHVAVIAPVSTNSGFEDGWHLATTYWTPEGGPYYNQYQEINPPEAWTSWWHEGFLCSGTSDWNQGRPEVRVISTTPDPTRVHSGDQAVQFFTFWRCHRGGLYQQIAVEPGQHYTAQAFGHAWYSRCSTKPHSAPYDSDCVTPINWAQLRLRVCIDPLGGIDPDVPSVVCSTWKEVYGKYGDPLVLRHVEAVSSIMTVFVQSNASHPLKHNDVYWDDVTLSESYQVFLPLIVRSSK